MLRLASKRISGVSREAPPTLRVLPQFSPEKVVDHHNYPQNVGSFNKNDPMVVMGLARAPACGDDMKFYIKGDQNARKIVDARFKTFGCGLGVASSSAEKLQSICHFVHLSFTTACLLRMPSMQVLKAMKLSEPWQQLLRQHLERQLSSSFYL